MVNDQLDKVQEVRSSNNKLWMDILRLSLKKSPKDTKEIMRRIRQNDALIVALFNDISEKPKRVGCNR